MDNCIFCRIAQSKAKAEMVYENDHIVAFRDIRPQAPVHILIIPRKHIATINDLTSEDKIIIGEIFLAAKKVAKIEKLSERGYRLVFNCNRDAGQDVYHIHLHLLGGRRMKWPPG